MTTTRRTSTSVPTALWDETNAKIREIKKIHGLELDKQDAVLLGLVTFVRTVMEVTKGKKILTVGDIEQALVAHIKKRADDRPT